MAQTGSAGYDLWKYVPTLSATVGSGQKNILNIAPDIGGAGSISLLRFTQGGALEIGQFWNSGSSSIRLIANEVLDSTMDISAQRIQTRDAATGTTDKTLSINTGAQNSDIWLGNGVSTVRVGAAATSTPLTAWFFGTTVAMTAGVVTVAWVPIKANAAVLISRAVAGGTIGTMTIAITTSTSFTITSSSATDTSTINYLVFNP